MCVCVYMLVLQPQPPVIRDRLAKFVHDTKVPGLRQRVKPLLLPCHQNLVSLHTGSLRKELENNVAVPATPTGHRQSWRSRLSTLRIENASGGTAGIAKESVYF